MISSKLHDRIEKEGRKKGFMIREAHGELDENGNFSFIIRLVSIKDFRKERSDPNWNTDTKLYV